jgi:hypothetical protein
LTTTVHTAMHRDLKTRNPESSLLEADAMTTMPLRRAWKFVTAGGNRK